MGLYVSQENVMSRRIKAILGISLCLMVCINVIAEIAENNGGSWELGFFLGIATIGISYFSMMLEED